MCFIWISEQTLTFALYIIYRLVFITEVESVYCAVGSESLYSTDTSRPERVKAFVHFVVSGLDSRGILVRFSAGGKFLPLQQCPDRLWGLFFEYLRSFPPWYRVWFLKFTTQIHTVLRLRMSGDTHPLHFTFTCMSRSWRHFPPSEIWLRPN